MNFIDLLILIFAIGCIVFYFYKHGWQNIKNEIYQATRKTRLMGGLSYWAFVLGTFVPACLVGFIGMQLEWPRMIYMTLTITVLIFQFYFLTLNRE